MPQAVILLAQQGRCSKELAAHVRDGNMLHAKPCVIRLFGVRGHTHYSRGCDFGNNRTVCYSVVRSWLSRQHHGLYIAIQPPTSLEIYSLVAIVAGGFLAGLIPVLRAYCQFLADDMPVQN